MTFEIACVVGKEVMIGMKIPVQIWGRVSPSPCSVLATTFGSYRRNQEIIELAKKWDLKYTVAETGVLLT